MKANYKKFFIWAGIGIVVFAHYPILTTLSAQLLAWVFSCETSFRGVFIIEECPVKGVKDLGNGLNGLGGNGWFMIITYPVSFILIIIWAITGLFLKRKT